MTATASTPAQPTMCHEVVAQTLLCVHSATAPTDADWNACMETSKRLDYVGVVVIAADLSFPGPTSAQRAKLAEVMKQRGTVAPVAVVTRSALHRGIVKVLGWMQRGNLVAFHPSRFREALEYTRVPPQAQGELMQRMHTFAAELGSPLTASIPIA